MSDHRILHLNAADAKAAVDLAARRDASNKRNGLPDKSFAEIQDRPKKSEDGIGAEIAFCRWAGCSPDLKDGTFGKWDTELFIGRVPIKIDVKCTRPENRDMIVPLLKRGKEPDAYVLMAGEIPDFVFSGIAWAADVMREERIRTLRIKNGPCYFMPEKHLMGMGEFEQDLRRRAGQIPTCQPITQNEAQLIAEMRERKRRQNETETGTQDQDYEPDEDKKGENKVSAKTIRVGVAWIKKTQAGTEIISMIITNPVGQDFRYTLWPSAQKATEASPDYNVTKQADPLPAWAGRSAGRPETDESGHTEAGDPGPGAGEDGQIPF